MREGLNPARRMDWGFAEMRIPTEDWAILRRRFPDLEAKDPEIREAAWREFSASELGELYRVTRSPRQAQRTARLGNAGIVSR